MIAEKYPESADQEYIINLSLRKTISVVFHNLQNFD